MRFDGPMAIYCEQSQATHAAYKSNESNNELVCVPLTYKDCINA